MISKTSLFPSFAATAIAALALACLTPSLRAADDGDNGKTCSNATLKGDYGIQASGFQFIPPGPSQFFVLAGLRTYDGNGGFTTTSNANGLTSGPAPNQTAVGTYHVNPDCTGTATVVVQQIHVTLVSTFVIVDQGKGVFEIAMNAGSPASLIARKK
jgi:hypothetical protein